MNNLIRASKDGSDWNIVDRTSCHYLRLGLCHSTVWSLLSAARFGHHRPGPMRSPSMFVWTAECVWRRIRVRTERWDVQHEYYASNVQTLEIFSLALLCEEIEGYCIIFPNLSPDHSSLSTNRTPLSFCRIYAHLVSSNPLLRQLSSWSLWGFFARYNQLSPLFFFFSRDSHVRLEYQKFWKVPLSWCNLCSCCNWNSNSYQWWRHAPAVGVINRMGETLEIQREMARW